MSKQCVELSPNQPTYQDTYGWVLYKLKRFNEAEEWLKKAVEGDDKSPVVIEHYGDVLYQLNQKKRLLNTGKKLKILAGTQNC